MTHHTPDPPLRIAFTTIQSGAHGEYGALLAASVAKTGLAEVLSIVPQELSMSPRAAPSLARTQVVSVPMGSVAAKLATPGLVLAALWRFRPHIIHDPVGSGISALLPLRPLLPQIAPLIVTEHNPEVHPGMRGWHHGVARALTRKTATRIHVHGPKAMKDMRALGVARERLFMVRHGAFDEYSDAAAGFQRDPNRILVFGALRPNKGIDMLPEIMTIVQESNPLAALCVAGKSPANIAPEAAATIDRALAKLAKMPGCEVHNRFIDEAEIPALFGGAGVCLLPYRTATQSGVAMIAMATEAPVVATRVGDIPDIIDHGQTGLLAEPTPEKIAAIIVETLDNPEKTAARARHAARFAREECAWPVIGAQMCAAYRSLLNSAEADAQC